mgnify:CR=1 FL=1
MSIRGVEELVFEDDVVPTTLNLKRDVSWASSQRDNQPMYDNYAVQRSSNKISNCIRLCNYAS